MELHTSSGAEGYIRIELDVTTSTNDYLRSRRAEFGGRMVLVTAEYQTQGRGATGEWQSDRGENLIFSLLIHPLTVEASGMFILSQAICLAVCRALNALRGGFRIKWPNDIYWGDRKVVGILIENELSGKCVSDCVIGVGVNVNQRKFSDDVPNPTSLSLVMGRDMDRREVLDGILRAFGAIYSKIEQGREEEIRDEYLKNLYRRDEPHTYRDSEGEFVATLLTVEPSGHLMLLDDGGNVRRYAFKGVQFII